MMHGARLKALAMILDMDGLMVDTERLYFSAERQVAGQFGKTADDKVLWKMMGRKPIESMQILAKELEIPVAPEVLLEQRDIIMREKIRNELKPMPGLFELFSNFYGKLKIAVATGSKKEFMDLIIDKLELKDKIDVLLSAEDIACGKPDPEIYFKTCKRLSVPPHRCIVLEDSENGVRAAKSAGCYVIAVPSEFSRGQNFQCADYVADSLFIASDFIRQLIEEGR